MIKIIKTLLNPKLPFTPRYPFSDVWKDRDEAAEKVYITKSESTPPLIIRINHEKITRQNEQKLTGFGVVRIRVREETRANTEQVQGTELGVQGGGSELAPIALII